MGRTKIHENAAERQAAYRARRAEREARAAAIRRDEEIVRELEQMERFARVWARVVIPDEIAGATNAMKRAAWLVYREPET